MIVERESKLVNAVRNETVHLRKSGHSQAQGYLAVIFNKLPFVLASDPEIRTPLITKYISLIVS